VGDLLDGVIDERSMSYMLLFGQAKINKEVLSMHFIILNIIKLHLLTISHT
jgi:hypothetical protein